MRCNAGSRALYRVGQYAIGATLVLVVVTPCAFGQSETVNRIVAIVNEDVITESDVHTHLSAMLAQQREPSQTSKTDVEDMRKVVLHHLIEQRLMLQEAKRAGVSLSTEEVLSKIQTLRESFNSEEEFEQSLAESSMSLEQLKEKIQDQLLVQRVIDSKVRSSILISPQEVAQAVSAHPELSTSGERVKLSHILVRINEDRPEAKARALIEDLHQQLTKGADFATLAQRYSEDQYKDAGGKMDWVAQGELLPELDQVIVTLKPGDLSPPVQTGLGFHLVKIEDRRSAASLSVLEANHAVYQQLYQQKFQRAFQQWLNELQQKAYIELVTPRARAAG